VSGFNTPLRIAVIGAGFSGTALAAVLQRTAGSRPIEINLFEKTGLFGAGDAYRTPFPYHLLNARAGDMSALEDEPSHFVEWLNANVPDKLEKNAPVNRQFVPRVYYHQYLAALLDAAQSNQLLKLNRIAEEVVDLKSGADGMTVITSGNQSFHADKVVLALGNNPPARLPFAVSPDIKVIQNPWDYAALTNIPADDPVVIVGTGLSMVDAVLTLDNQRHRGKITAISRRGLLPLPHSDKCEAVSLNTDVMPDSIPGMMKVLRQHAEMLAEEGGDWRGIFSAMRLALPDLWRRMSERTRKQFLRHALPYWNIHRHRVHVTLYDLLTRMQKEKRLEVLAGRILSAKNNHLQLRLRQSHEVREVPAKHIINCMGSSFEPSVQPLVKSLVNKNMAQLDTLQLGFCVNENYQLKMPDGKSFASCYVIGPLMRGEEWETIAVPEIRKQCKSLAKLLLKA
jgi:uncharacterized NAD(P)/FAD-binding protein YdhS